MAFKDLREFLDGRHLDLPIDGTVYRVCDVDAATGLWVQKVMDLGIAAAQGREVDGVVLDDDEERDVYRRVLGDTYDQMTADGVGWADLKHAAVTAMIWIAFDEAAAEKYWESGSGEVPAPAPGPNRASRRASSAAARKTRSRASTSTTRVSRAATPTTPSRGQKSSGSGR